MARHYHDTIDTRIRFTEHADVIDPPVLAALHDVYPDGTAQFWGVTPGVSGANVGKWKKLMPGDAVFFYGEKKIYLAGHIALPFQNRALADRLWGRNANGLTWELMFALVNLRDVTLPIDEIRAALDWSDKAFIQGFTVVEGHRADELAELVNLQDTGNLLVACEAFTRKVRSVTAPDGPTDGTRTASWRREHPLLKKRLVELAGDTCGLCGEGLPPAFLVGAHIKKRALCTEDERKDFDNVGMLACVLGCDSLFERGYISVDKGGKILISDMVAESSTVAEFVESRLEGRISAWWNPEREKYYAWHREHVFLAVHNGTTPESHRFPADSSTPG
ncbi:hypothetical protein [Amycolatopsis sp. GA6-003]|uniref:hypothetical protein n=1 Tax=Amycolatopsis sp. GA6-003 TaxID=2652444 RepID=UPI0039170399